LATFGVERIRVVEWLPDDPWPRAMVEGQPDDDATGDGDDGAAAERWAAVQVGVRRVLGLAAELGIAPAAATTELAPEPSLGTYQAAAVLPIGPADEYRVLAGAGVVDRLTLLEEMVAEQGELLEARLRMG
jgi:Lon protease-like protein